MTATIISATPSTGAGTAYSAGNDGTLTIQTGATAGAQVNAVVLDAAGQATLLKPPKLDAAAVVSMVRLNTANGYGSTNTVIRRFTNVVTNTGSDITYADSATAGASFTINTAGVYSIAYSEQSNAYTVFGVSLNSSQLTTGIGSINISDVLFQSGVATNEVAGSAGAYYLPAGAVVRPHTSGAGSSASPSQTQFTITKVA